MKVLYRGFLTFLILFALTQAAWKEKEYQFSKVKRLKCDPNLKYIFENFSCFAKPVSRNSTSVTVIFQTKMPFNVFHVSLIKFIENITEI